MCLHRPFTAFAETVLSDATTQIFSAPEHRE
jgi:hypothetical protein